MERWEYDIRVWEADARRDEAQEYLKIRWPDWKPPRYAVQSLTPWLDSLGKDGWELVTMQPVQQFSEGGLGIAAAPGTRSYLVVLKRRLPEEAAR